MSADHWADGDDLWSFEQQISGAVNEIIEQIREDLVELCMAEPPLRQVNATNLLLTAHHRIAAVAARLTDGQSKVVID